MHSKTQPGIDFISFLETDQPMATKERLTLVGKRVVGWEKVATESVFWIRLAQNLKAGMVVVGL